MRAFIAIELPEQIREKLGEITKDITSSNIIMNSVKPENMHLNLLFLGEISEEEAGLVSEKIKSITINSFTLRIDNIGFFPSKKYPRVMHMTLEHNEELFALHEIIKDKVQEIQNIFEDDKEFVGHITLARIKSIKDKKEFSLEIDKIMSEKLESLRELSFTVNKFYLKKSTLTPNGPVYETLGVVELEKDR